AEATQQTRKQAGKWLLKAADVAAAAGATPEAVRHVRASFDCVEAGQLPRLHERIGDVTAGDSGLEEYRLALEQYEAVNAPVEDQLRALAGMLMVSTRWAGSVGDRPSEEWMADLRARTPAPEACERPLLDRPFSCRRRVLPVLDPGDSRTDPAGA